ncbi:VOC family protein [Chryseobacterium indoltheticum]|uniref:VOC family protein n=1 Tax=Chryseobacterium indoltheticum TaxID=254 RepID=UPI003F4962F2
MSDSDAKGSLTWSPTKETTEYFEPSKREFMINYTVENLEALVEELKKEEVTILDEIEVYDFGKFVHILDLEGIKLNCGNQNNLFLIENIFGGTKGAAETL